MTILLDGVAYGALLFLISVGLTVTLGLMNVVNLAHGAFGMAGGYACVALLNRFHVPFPVALGGAALIAGLLGLLLERLLYRRLYGASHLDQALFSIGLVFIAMAAAQYLFGASQQPLQLPGYLQGQARIAGIEVGVYRLALIVAGFGTAALLQLVVQRTRLGAMLRAAVDDPRAARAIGIDVDRVFAATFAVGAALAGLGGALGVELLGLDPSFPLKYLVYYLIVVAAGGTGTVIGALAAALILGIADVLGKYYAPQFGAFVIYAVMIAMLVLRPQGLFGRPAARAR